MDPVTSLSVLENLIIDLRIFLYCTDPYVIEITFNFAIQLTVCQSSVNPLSSHQTSFFSSFFSATKTSLEVFILVRAYPVARVYRKNLCPESRLVGMSWLAGVVVNIDTAKIVNSLVIINQRNTTPSVILTRT